MRLQRLINSPVWFTPPADLFQGSPKSICFLGSGSAGDPRPSKVLALWGILTIPLLFVPLLIPSREDFQAQEISSSIQAKQGEIVSLILKLEPGIDSVVGSFLNQPIPFFRKTEEEFSAMIGIDLEQLPGPQPLGVTWEKGGTIGTRQYLINVLSASFGTQELTLPKGMVDLDPPTLARVQKEQERLKEIFSGSHQQKLWEGNFLVPVEGKVLGTFGLRRVLNGQPRNPHTGEDISAPLGTPVLASNGGRVILVGDFYFNGHSVIIDHGMGLFSMYFHLFNVMVREGETVTRGEQIGLVGQSGRATGPHLHWGMRLNGARVNPFSLVEKSLD